MSAAGHGGYVRLYRSILGHPAFRNDAEALAFAWLVIRAAWRPVRVRYRDRTIALARGQLAVSVRDMARSLDRDKAWVERLLKRLKAEAMIETATETGVSLITICNYASFQLSAEDSETPAGTVGKTPAGTGARQARDTEQRRESRVKQEITAQERARADAPAPARNVGTAPLSRTDWLDRANLLRQTGRLAEAAEAERQAAACPQAPLQVVPLPTAKPTPRRPHEAAYRPHAGPAGVVAIGMQVAAELEQDERGTAARAAG